MRLWLPVLKYLMSDPGTAVEPTMGATTSKAEREFSHRATAFLLCPACCLAELHEDYQGYVLLLYPVSYLTSNRAGR